MPKPQPSRRRVPCYPRSSEYSGTLGTPTGSRGLMNMRRTTAGTAMSRKVSLKAWHGLLGKYVVDSTLFERPKSSQSNATRPTK